MARAVSPHSMPAPQGGLSSRRRRDMHTQSRMHSGWRVESAAACFEPMLLAPMLPTTPSPKARKRLPCCSLAASRASPPWMGLRLPCRAVATIASPRRKRRRGERLAWVCGLLSLRTPPRTSRRGRAWWSVRVVCISASRSCGRHTYHSSVCLASEIAREEGEAGRGPT
jgi:hypothetical protein